MPSRELVLEVFWQMLFIRQFELRAEAAYQEGKMGGFFHSYIGQEAIQTAAVAAIGQKNWYATSYRCHALAWLLGASANELMAELFGRATGNALGRGGSMHFFAERLLGGFGIVGGQIPIATGAAFTLKYQGNDQEIAVCFLGDGAVPQGAFHESVNLAALWKLPCLYIIENNQWGMGTAVKEAVSVERLAEEKAPGYGIQGYTVDGMDFFACYALFEKLKKEILQSGKPILVEAITERFKGHSISDPGLYRSKDGLRHLQQKDPIALVQARLLQEGTLTEVEVKSLQQRAKEQVLEALAFAEASPWPNPDLLEQDVFAPRKGE